jgi:hypothetical protein
MGINQGLASTIGSVSGEGALHGCCNRRGAQVTIPITF